MTYFQFKFEHSTWFQSFADNLNPYVYFHLAIEIWTVFFGLSYIGCLWFEIPFLSYLHSSSFRRTCVWSHVLTT